MYTGQDLKEVLKNYTSGFHAVVPFDAASDRLLLLDFTAANTELTDKILNDTNLFTQYITEKLRNAGVRYGIGGYGEHRTIYRRSGIFGPHPGLPPTGEGAANAQPTLKQNRESNAGEFYQAADPTTYSLLKNFALQHRHKPTAAEDLLWQQLRGSRLNGYSFRRQHIIGQYIADFVCLAKKLIIEIDGLQHQLPDNAATDEERTLWLNLKGYEVVRFSNNEVLFETEKVLQSISHTLKALSFAERKVYEKNGASSQSLPGAPVSLSPLGEEPVPPLREPGIGTRTLHLGTDIWGAPHMPVMAPLDGIVHSFGFHPALGDYGAVIILSHQLSGISFHTLYGHLSLSSIKNLHEGDRIRQGDVFAELGIPQENGQWPPHLHFQVMQDMQGWKGDYPGVCAFSEKTQWLQNCIDPDLILNMNRFI